MILGTLIVGTSCNRVPSHVIQPDDMAELMADLQTAESVADLNYAAYESDSSRQALKQAVLERHGVTQEQLDTSFVWYGGHMDKYLAVFDDVEAILQDRLDKSQSAAMAAVSASVSGDSVDVWSQSRQMRIDAASAARIVTFSIKADRNTERGDIYSWRVKLHNAMSATHWGITAEYDDGGQDVLYQQSYNDGWQQAVFFTDSTRTLKKLYGFLEVPMPLNKGAVYLDSIELVRKRLNPSQYVQRYRQRNYNWKKDGK